MKNYILASFCLFLTAGWAFFYGQAKAHYTKPDHYIAKIKKLHQQLGKEKLRTVLTQYEFEGFRQYVATLLPGVIKEKGSGEAGYPYRSLASVVQKTQVEEILVQDAKQIFAKAKADFRQKRYLDALRGFEKIIEQHSYSAHVPESLFLKLESHFQMREFSQALQTYETLLQLYPADELTGYAMIRVGKIYEYESRFQDAVQIYKSVLLAFPQREISSLAREQLRASGL